MNLDSKFVPTLPTLQAVARAAKMQAPAELDPSRGSWLSGPEIVPLGTVDKWCGTALTTNQSVARVNCRVLDLAGILPGDEIMLDRSEEPQSGDAVCVQIYNINRDGSEIVLRRYDPPYVTTETTDQTARARPLLVDNERARIMSVVVELRRRRNADA